MVTEMAVAFANIIMVNIEKEVLRQSTYKPLVWKRFVNDVFSLWNITKDEVDEFIERGLSYLMNEVSKWGTQSVQTVNETTRLQMYDL